MLVHWVWSMVRHGWSEMNFAMEGDDDDDGGSAEQRVDIVIVCGRDRGKIDDEWTLHFPFELEIHN